MQTGFLISPRCLHCSVDGSRAGVVSHYADGGAKFEQEGRNGGGAGGFIPNADSHHTDESRDSRRPTLNERLCVAPLKGGELSCAKTAGFGKVRRRIGVSTRIYIWNRWRQTERERERERENKQRARGTARNLRR